MDLIPTEIKLAIVRFLIEESPESAYAYATGALTPVRQAYVRQIHFTALLPDYVQRRRSETESEKQKNNEAFSGAVASLMEFLRAWLSPHDGGIELQLSTACAIDLRDMRPGMGMAILDLRERRKRCLSSYVALNKGFYRQLPELPAVSKFTCPAADMNQRRLVPATCCEIASRFSRLRAIDWHLADGSHDSDFRLQLRNDFAAGLSSASSLIPESVRDFTLGYSSAPCVERFFPDEDPRICPGAARDALSVALRNLSVQMETVTLQMTSIGSEFLWDPELPPDQQAHWPRLREMELNFDGQTPQGEELFDWDPSDMPDDDPESDPPSSLSRVVPIPAQHRPYQLAFARAAGRMPKLRHLCALCGYQVRVLMDYTVRPGGAEFHYEDYQNSPVVVGLVTQEVQEEWWKTAHAHLREGDEFHFEVVDDGAVFEFRRRNSNGLPGQEPPERMVIDWTRVI
ncbi:hypothetical protein PG997_005415 [Apiospora hydei]|uniref:Uncharacterized protein n=1 Tax=Apiospora hydei TaxID=1337664 RepID=A0ABR1X530_9PEZI